MSELVKEAFTNEFGQVIKPGDEVVYAGTSWKNTSIRKGVFGGVYYATVTKYRTIYDENGNQIMDERYGRRYPKYETYSERAVVAVRIDGVDAGKIWKWVTDPETGKKDYVKTQESRIRTAVLPLKRVYKLDTSLKEFEGKSF